MVAEAGFDSLERLLKRLSAFAELTHKLAKKPWGALARPRHSTLGSVLLSEVRTTDVESWLRSFPQAKSSCAKIRNLLSVLFNLACCHEFFDRNPIRLVRQGAKRRTNRAC
jgi:hypothetical protein